MSLISPAEVERLAKICGLFSSDYVGERAAAAHKADQIVRAAGLTWPDVLQATEHKGRSDDGRRQRGRGLGPGDILRHPDAQLTAWECTFLSSLVRRSRSWTPRQQQVFTEIRDRVVGAPR